MRITYITAQLPYGKGEQFITPEINEMLSRGNDITVIPTRPSKKWLNISSNAGISFNTVFIPLFSFDIFVKCLYISFRYPIAVLRILSKIICKSGSIKNLLKNLVVLPKGLVTGQFIKNNSFQHIHAHWSSTPSTVGYIASYISNVPWSFTSHRGDIVEKNMCREKARTAKFFRAINTIGYNWMAELVGDALISKCSIIHCGVAVPDTGRISSGSLNTKKFTIAVPANLLPVKGHRYLLEALAMCGNKIDFECHLFGDGPLKGEIEAYIGEKKLEDKVFLKGSLPHNELLNLYAKGGINCVVLPSIVTDWGEHEGVPVSLMEALAYQIPVISTNTGGIPELLGGIEGTIVEQRNPRMLCEAIINMADNENLRRNVINKGYDLVRREFNIARVVDELIECMNQG